MNVEKPEKTREKYQWSETRTVQIHSICINDSHKGEKRKKQYIYIYMFGRGQPIWCPTHIGLFSFASTSKKGDFFRVLVKNAITHYSDVVRIFWTLGNFLVKLFRALASYE